MDWKDWRAVENRPDKLSRHSHVVGKAQARFPFVRKRITSFDCFSHGGHNPARGEAHHVPTHRPGQTQWQA